MSLDKNKATELMINANKYIPKLCIFMVLCWVVAPILISIGATTDLAFFSALGVFISFVSTILLYVIIIFVFFSVAKVNVRPTQQNTSKNEPLSPIEKTLSQQEEYPQEEYLPQEQEYISQVQEYNYNNASYNTPEMNYATSDKQAQKQFEKEMFTAQHPILGLLKYKIIPFIWFLAILCAIITGVIYLLNHIYGIKLHF